MIEGIAKIRDEKDYRETIMDSSSSLKDFSMDRRKYYRKYILQEPVEEKDTQSITIGRCVETLLLEPEMFDKRFYLSACSSAPTGLMLEFVEALYKSEKEATNEENVVMRPFEDLVKDAYVASGFKISIDQVLKKFMGSEAEIYFNEIRTVRANDLTVVTAEDIANCENIVNELKTNFVTRDIVNLTDNERWEVKNQYQIEGYEVDGHKFKSMIDKVVTDHKEKTIQPYDLKCVWNVEGFYDDYYLYRRAYIQAYLYWMACIYVVDNSAVKGYKVLPTRFIVCDSINYYNPLIYSLTEKDLDDAEQGFEHKGRRYPGVNEIITNLKWALENNMWTISRENYINRGIRNIKE